MKRMIEKWLIRLWNGRAARRHSGGVDARGLDLGAIVTDDDGTAGRATVTQGKRAEHLAVLGKTGAGKSFLLRHIARQDVASGRGFLYFDLHGDATDFIVGCVAEQERILHRDLSERVVIIDPADPEFSVGMNPLEAAEPCRAVRPNCRVRTGPS